MDLEEVEQDPEPSTVSGADEAALELMKQLITLASGVLALGAAFIDKLPKSSVYLLAILVLSWVALVASIFFGLRTISAIVKSRLLSNTEWSRGKGRKYGRLSQAGFIGGIILFAAFALTSLIVPAKDEKGLTITINAEDPRSMEILKTFRFEQPSPLPSPLASPPSSGSQ